MPEQAQGRPVVLVIAGDGPDRQTLEALSNELGLQARVRWAGWQNDPTPFYELADVFVCPSRHEPLGNVILEAWQHRLPVLSTRNEGALELVRDGSNGVLAPLSDADGLARSLAAMLDMPAEAREQLAAAGYQTVQSEHHENAVVGAYLELYEKLGAQRRSAR